ncbi:hypothetical protein LR48_Vigan06g090200 [Vigna angularis]|uniref:Uncharacterized protein n=1 Tax=Phaseolus angularis TaxID=3914 RepID=A0A0L9USA0_PHAAN|nr:hypothetical protein LR48_Vigan06g090200 [Vigna angularis]
MKISVSYCKNVEATFNSMKMHIGQLINQMEGCEKNAKERKEKENESGKELIWELQATGFPWNLAPSSGIQSLGSPRTKELSISSHSAI